MWEHPEKWLQIIIERKQLHHRGKERQWAAMEGQGHIYGKCGRFSESIVQTTLLTPNVCDPCCCKHGLSTKETRGQGRKDALEEAFSAGSPDVG